MKDSVVIVVAAIGVVVTFLISILLSVITREEVIQEGGRKRVVLTIFSVLAFALVLVFIADFPFYSLYNFIFYNLLVFWSTGGSLPNGHENLVSFLLKGLPANKFLFCIKITTGAVVISAVLVSVMYFLRRAFKILNLKLFYNVLAWGIYYEIIMTFLMLLGIWLDLQTPVHPSPLNLRVGFWFYSNYR